MNELLELIKQFNKDRNVYITINYFKLYDAYEIRMSEYDHERNTTYRVKKLICVNDFLSAKIPTYEVFVKVLNEMYEELKGAAKDERESRETGSGEVE